MATVQRDIYADFTNGAFVQSNLNAQRVSLPPCFHQDTLRLIVHPLEFDPSRAANLGPYAEITPTGMALIVSIFTTTGTLLASQNTFAVVGDTLVGAINLNTAAMATAFATVDSITAVIEFEFSDADGSITIQSRTLTINREYIVVGAPTITPPDEYYTKAEIDALFVRFSGNPAGNSIELTSPDGTKAVELKCKDDGSFDAEPT